MWPTARPEVGPDPRTGGGVAVGTTGGTAEHGRQPLALGPTPGKRHSEYRRGAATPPCKIWWTMLAVAAAVFAGPARAADRTGELSPAAAAQVEKALVSLPAPPVWDAKADAGVWTLDDIKAAFARVTDTPPEVNAIHATFLRPGARWLKDYRRWFHTLQDKLDFHYEEQVWDCDNYANGFVAFADLLTLRAGETRGRLCVGWASVYYETPFAGIGRGAHAVVIVGTRDGFFIIEPQDGTTVPLREFPNRDTIVAVYF